MLFLNFLRFFFKFYLAYLENRKAADSLRIFCYRLHMKPFRWYPKGTAQHRKISSNPLSESDYQQELGRRLTIGLVRQVTRMANARYCNGIQHILQAQA